MTHGWHAQDTLNLEPMSRATLKWVCCETRENVTCEGVLFTEFAFAHLCLSTFSWLTSAWFWFCLRSSLMEDNGNMSIQTSLRRFKSSENLPIHLTIWTFPLLARIKWQNLHTSTLELPQWSGVSTCPWNTLLHLRISEFLSQRVLCTFLHLRQVDSSVPVLVFLLQALRGPTVDQRRSAPRTWTNHKVVESLSWSHFLLSIDLTTLRDVIQP